MGKMPQISGKELGRILLRLGFQFKSQRGSHMEFQRGKTETIIVPNHRIIRRGTLHDILKYLGLSLEDFRRLL
jgi:predicted RNA binding protein YcfA (HicA-like mRNA interferase family)